MASIHFCNEVKGMKKGVLKYVLSILLTITLSACQLPIPTQRVDPSVDKTSHIMPGISSKEDVRKLLGEPIVSPEGLDVDVYYFPGHQKYITLAFFLIPFHETIEVKSYVLITYHDGLVSEMDIGSYENYNNDILMADRYEFDCSSRTLLVVNHPDQLLTTEEALGSNAQADSCSVFIAPSATVFIDKSYIGAFYGPGYFHRSVSPGLHEISGCYLRSSLNLFSNYNPDCPKMDFTCADQQPIYFELTSHREKKFFGDNYETVIIKKINNRPKDFLERRLIIDQRYEVYLPGHKVYKHD